MLRLLVFVLAGSLLVPIAWAQPDASSASDAEQAVRGTIDALFDGMRAGDGTAVRAVFHEEARLHTALGPGDTTAVRTTPVDAFIKAVERPHEKVWDERVWDVEIRVDGPLASAWVPYAFYHGETLSHCGVNAMQLVQQADGWVILSLTDTRHQDCNVPAKVQKG